MPRFNIEPNVVRLNQMIVFKIIYKQNFSHFVISFLSGLSSCSFVHRT